MTPSAPALPGVSFVPADSPAVSAFLAGRSRVVAGTGHRPNKFPRRAATTLPPLPASIADTDRSLKHDPFGVYTRRGWDCLVGFAAGQLTLLGADAVIAGGALGWDQVLAEAALAQGLPLLVAVPFETQASLWPVYARDIWLRHLQAADACVCVTPVTSLLAPGARSTRDLDLEAMKRAMGARNKFMVERAGHVLAFHNGTSGGTGNCLRDVERARVPFTNAWRDFAALVRA